MCGYLKCFVRVNNDPTIGYTIVSQNRMKLSDLKQAYTLAKKLEQTHSIQHLALERPRKVYLASCLRRQFEKDHNRNELLPNSKRKHIGDKDRKMIVQKHRVAPTPSVLFGISRDKIKEFRRVFPSFLEQHVINSTAFWEQLKVEQDRCMAIVRDYPRLLVDFQFFLDSHGTVYHMDLDRMTQPLRFQFTKELEVSYTNKLSTQFAYMKERTLAAIANHNNNQTKWTTKTEPSKKT